MSKYSYSLDIGKDLRQKPKSGEALGAKEVKEQIKKGQKKIQIRPLQEHDSFEGDDWQGSQAKPLTDSEKDVFDILSEVVREKKENNFEIFFAKHASVFLLIFLVLFGWFNLTKTDKLTFIEQISDADVNTQLLSSVTKKIFIDWPLLGIAEKQKKIQELFQVLMNDPAVKEKKKQFAEMLKNQYKTDSGQVFLYTDESYSILSNAEKTSEGKSTGDFLARTVYYFFLLPKNLPFLSADLFATAFYTPAILGILIAVMTFVFAKKATKSPRAAFFAAFLLLINHSFFAKAYAGNLNSALLHLLFSVVLNFMLLCIISAPRTVKVISLFAGIPVFLLYMKISNYMWKLWAAVAVFYLITIFIMFMFRIKNNEEKSFYNSLYLFAGIFAMLFSMVFILESSSLIFNYNPDFFAGKILLVLGLTGASYLIVKNLKSMDSKEIFVISWFLAMLFMTYASKSALYLLSLPASIVAGMLIEKIYSYMFSFAQGLKTGLSDSTIHLSLLVFLPLFFLFANGDNIGITKTVYPSATMAHLSVGDFVQYELNADSELLVFDKNFMWQYFTKKNAPRDKKQELTNILLSDYTDAHKKLKCTDCSVVLAVDEDALYTLLNENNAENDKFLFSKIKKCNEEGEKILRCGKPVVSLLNNSVENKEAKTSLLLVVNGTALHNSVEDVEQTLVLYEADDGQYYSFVVNQNALNTALVRMLAGEELPGFKLRKQTYEPVRVVLYEYGGEEENS